MPQTTLRFGTLSVLSIWLQLQDVFTPVVPKVLDGDAAVLPGDGNQHRLLQMHVEYPSVGLEKNTSFGKQRSRRQKPSVQD